MSKIYRIIDSENGEVELLVSKEYVDLRIQALKNAILSHEQNIVTAHTNSSSTLVETAGLLDKEEIVDIDLNIGVPEVTLESLEQDSQHRLLTDTQIEAFKNKATTFEVETAIEDVKNELKSSFNDQYINLLNLPGAVDKLKEIAEVIQSSDTLSALLSALDERVTEDELSEHTSSHSHLTNNDRKALNILLNLINDGFIEKIKDIGKFAEKSEQSISAESLDGYTVTDLLSCHHENKILGTSYNNGLYDDTGVNLLFNTATQDGKDAIKEAFCNGWLKSEVGVITLRSGDYVINGTINLHRDEQLSQLIIRGAGDATRLYPGANIDFNNVTIENLCIEKVINDITVEIHNYVKLIDMTFRDCHIVFDDSVKLMIDRCTFDRCTFEFGTACSNMMIVNSYFRGGPLPKYLSRTSVINGNLEY